MCEPTSSFYHIGVGYALYFDFIKYSIYLLVLLFAVSGLYNLVTNIVAGDCTVTNLTCLGDYISIMAIQNKFNHPELIEGQLIVNLISVILMMLYFHYIRFRFRKASIKADDITITPSDYTIRLKNLPIDVSNDDLKNWILELGDDNNTLEIRKINRAFQILEYLEAKQKLTGLQNKVKKASVKNKPILGKQIDELNEYLKKFKAEKDFTVTKTAFVTFKTAAQADFVKKQFQKSLLRQLIDFLTPFLKSKTRLNGTRVDVVRAPEPTDVVWPNLCYKTKTIIKWRIFTAFMTLVLIGASFGLIIGINKLQVIMIFHLKFLARGCQ